MNHRYVVTAPTGGRILLAAVRPDGGDVRFVEGVDFQVYRTDDAGAADHGTAGGVGENLARDGRPAKLEAQSIRTPVRGRGGDGDFQGLPSRVEFSIDQYGRA